MSRFLIERQQYVTLTGSNHPDHSELLRTLWHTMEDETLAHRVANKLNESATDGVRFVVIVTPDVTNQGNQ